MPAAVPAAVGKKILFFSDLHYSGKEKELVSEIRSAVSQYAPDLLICGGDFTADAAEVKYLPEVLRSLADAAPCCITIPGNWERGKSWLSQGFWKQFFQQYNWHYLCNEGIKIGDWGWICGSDDINRGTPDTLPVPPEPRQAILLAHRPDTVIHLDWERKLKNYPLSLCGHTHGGQIRLPFAGALTAPSHYWVKFTGGLFGRRSKGPRMIVSTGVHHASFPWRINCRREIILIEFA